MITSKTYADIIEFAVNAHKGQTRKGNGDPYITHPLSVADRIRKIKKGSKNLWLLAGAAMLHDTVEDCGVTIGEITERFGVHIASIVEELTLDKTKYETEGKTNYLTRRMIAMSSYALTLKLCDRLDNLEDMDDMDEEFRTRYAQETFDILLALQEEVNFTKTQKKLVKKISKVLDKIG